VGRGGREEGGEPQTERCSRCLLNIPLFISRFPRLSVPRVYLQRGKGEGGRREEKGGASCRANSLPTESDSMASSLFSITLVESSSLKSGSSRRCWRHGRLEPDKKEGRKEEGEA